MKFVSAQTMRELDAATIEVDQVPGSTLMARAGRGIARLIHRFGADLGRPTNASILLLAGRGNNGGDAFVAARHLHQLGHRVRVILAAESEAVQGDARQALDHMLAAGIPLTTWPNETQWNFDALDLPHIDIVVDGLLGTGASGAPRGAIAAAVRLINQCSSYIVALDAPTGLDDVSSPPAHPVVRADTTLTLGLPKIEFLRRHACDSTGSIHLIPIGIDAARIDAAPGTPELTMLHESWCTEQRSQRPANAHKGDFGRVLIAGGSRHMSGAPTLAACAAVRTGAGLVHVQTPASIADRVAIGCPEAMVRPLPEAHSGGLAQELDPTGCDAVLFGPGAGRSHETRARAEHLLRTFQGPLLLDADAITVFANEPKALRRASGPLVLTPHPGELATLLGCSTSQIQVDRATALGEAVDRTQAVVVLKGAGTLIGTPKTRTQRINLNGNPGMATGGSGDVLAGMLAALLAQQIDPFDAASLAVFHHGAAGDRAARRTSQEALSARDLIP